MALVKEPENVQENDRKESLILPGETTYNSGVVAFRQQAKILQQWAEFSLKQNDQFMGDQNALSRAIFIHQPPLIELPAIYNWKKDQGPNSNALIIHYIGSWKLEIIKDLSL
jgi:hypothetical protein